MHRRSRSRSRHLGALLAAVVWVVFPAVAHTQQAPVDTANAVYLEVFGSGGAYSVNYERRIVERLSARIGLASWTAEPLFGGNDSTYTTVPITLQTLIGNGRHRLELGGGILLGNRSGDRPPGTSGRFTSLSGIVGYRYQRREAGFLFRAVATPLYGFGDEEVAYPEKGMFPSFGLSIGYAF